MESALYSMWQIDIRSSVRNDLYICKEFNIQPSEIAKMVFFRYEWLIDDINEYQKKKEEEHKAQEKQYRMQQPKLPKVNLPRH